MKAGAARLKILVAAVFWVLSAAFLGGCGERPQGPKFKLTDLTSADFGKALDLTDHHGKPRTLADFRGKVVMVFFGFTHLSLIHISEPTRH